MTESDSFGLDFGRRTSGFRSVLTLYPRGREVYTHECETDLNKEEPEACKTGVYRGNQCQTDSREPNRPTLVCVETPPVVQQGK